MKFNNVVVPKPLLKNNGDGTFTAQAGATIYLNYGGQQLVPQIYGEDEEVWEFIKECRPELYKIIEKHFLQLAIAEIVEEE